MLCVCSVVKVLLVFVVMVVSLFVFSMRRCRLFRCLGRCFILVLDMVMLISGMLLVCVLVSSSG